MHSVGLSFYNGVHVDFYTGGAKVQRLMGVDVRKDWSMRRRRVRASKFAVGGVVELGWLGAIHSGGGGGGGGGGVKKLFQFY